MKTLLFGGTGVISRAVVDQLIDRGHAVTVVTRGRTAAPHSAAEWIQKDRYDIEGLSAALSGRRFDVVLDMISFTADDARHTLRLVGSSTEQVIVVSSVAVYRRPLSASPVTEDSEALWTEPGFQYGYQKAEMERYLRTQVGRGVPVTIVRPSLTFGAGSRNVGILRQNIGLVARMKSGRPVVLFDDGSCPWNFSFAADVAQAIMLLMGNAGAIGEAVHLASDDAHTWRDFYLAIGRIAGAEPDIRFLPTSTLWQADPERFAHILYEKSHPGLYDLTKLHSLAPDYAMKVQLEDGLRDLIRSWETDGLTADPELDALEDQLVSITAGR